MEKARSSGVVLGLAGLVSLGLPMSVAGQQPAGFVTRPVPTADADTTLVERPPDVPRLHHTHLNSLDPDAAIDWYVDVWPQGERGEVAGYPAFVAAVPVLFSEVEEAPAGGWDFDRDRASPQSAFWHIGAFGNTTARFEALEARGHTALRLARTADDDEGVVRSGLAGEEPRPGGFGYLVGPDGALVEITGGPNTNPSFAHVHLFGERPRCAANWYAEVLGFALPSGRDPDTGNPVPRERYEPCEGERAPPTWPSLDPAGTVRGPSASIRHGSGTISIYPRQCLGEQCEVDEPLVPSRGQVLDHVAFEVEDIDEWIAWLEQEGVTFLGSRSLFGGLGDEAWRVVIEGPDGLSIELVQPRRPRVIERLMSERWIHDGQHPDFVTPESTRIDYHLTYVNRRGRPGGLDSYGLDTRFGNAFLSMRAPQNVFNSLRAPAPDVEYRASEFRDPAEERARSLMRWRTEALTLPAAPFWEVPVALPDGSVDVGVAWVDTVSHSADPGSGLEETLEGVWRYRVVSDTVVDGRTFPRVAVEADVSYTAHLVPSIDLGGYLTPQPRVRREASGRLSGMMTLDPSLGLRIEGSDTLRLSGTITLLEPDGSALVTDGDYERTQTWALTDSLDWAAALEARRTAASNARTGMLILARDSVEERLRRGDAELADSLLSVYASAESPEQRTEILRLLTRNVRDRNWYAEIEPVHLAAGDSAYVIARRLGRQNASSWGARQAPPFEPAIAEDLVDWLERPDDLWALGIHPRHVYRDLLEYVPRWATSDPSPCELGGCRRLADRALASDVESVRDLGVIVHFLLEPADGYAELTRRHAEGSELIESVWNVAAGMPDETGTPRIERVSLAPSDWTTWRDLGVSASPSPWLWQAATLYRRRTGWDPTTEVRAARMTAESDSARIVLGWALELLGASVDPGPGEIAATLVDPESSDIAFADASRLAGTLLRGADEDPELSDIVVTAVLDMLLDGGEGEPLFEPLSRLDYATDPIRTAAQGFHGVRNRGFILRPSDFPPALDAERLRTLAAGRAVVQDSAATADWDEREGGVLLKVQPFLRTGDLGMFGWSWTVYQRRGPDQAPLGYAGGGSFLLVRDGDAWRIVSSSVWIT